MKRTVTAAVAGLALAGLIGVGVATAADGNGPAGRLGEALSGLVSKGTITQQQADDVAEALGKAHEQDRAEREQDRTERRAEMDALLEQTLDMDMDAVRQRLMAGESLLEIAGDSADELAAGMLSKLAERLDTAVDEGRITSDQAAETLTRAQDRADSWLAGEDTGRGGGLGLLQGPGGGMGPRGGMGHPGPGHGPQGWGEQNLGDHQPPWGSADAAPTSWQI